MKKGKTEETPPLKKSKKKVEPVSGGVDPLAPQGLEEESLLPQERSPPQKKMSMNLKPSWEEDENAPESSTPDLRTGKEAPIESHQNEIEKPGSVPFSTAPVSPLDLLRMKIRGGEQGLAEIERVLGESSFLFKGLETNLARLKILLVEAKIKLAEADIKLSEAEIAPAASFSLLEIESRVSLAESKIGEAERVLASLSANAQGKGHLSRLKIRIAAMKIRLAEIQIALAGISVSEGATPKADFPLPVQAQVIESPKPTPLPTEVRPERIVTPEENTLQDLSPREQVGIREERNKQDRPPELRIEPVRIKEKSGESLTSHEEQKDKVIVPELASGPSPFESGINLDRVRIRKEEGSTADDTAPVVQERVQIRSDERESAWVTEDGSLKIVSREKTGMETLQEQEKFRISIHQPEVEKALVIEEQNKRGIELRKQGKIDEALACFDRVLELDPKDDAALHNKGVALRTAGRYEEALVCLDKALERDPNNQVIWFNRGFVLGKLERYEEALKAFDRVLSLNSTHGSSWYNKGKLLQKLGRVEEAEEHLKKAQELGYR
ncbi:MAG: tetratricopeptide repeat protein [Methanomicrobiales archaeon]|nr:tetratricopeptide repeat protein [Methanomicrobiales archaeon]